jgi:hypothetical protein
VPISDWNKIKAQYPYIEIADEDLPQWEKDLIDKRLDAISQNSENLQPIEILLEELRRKI